MMALKSDEFGYCRYCAFLVAAKDGRLLPHKRRSGSYIDKLCDGGGRKAHKQPGPEARPCIPRTAKPKKKEVVPDADAATAGDATTD